MRRRLAAKDGWVFDDDAFAAAVDRVRDELVDGLLAVAFDGSMAAERAVAEFSARWTARLVGQVRVLPEPPVRAAHVTLGLEQWHEVAVLKFVHRRFVLQRADLASHQRGQATVLTGLVDALVDWLGERDAPRLPPRLHDLVELARAEYAATHAAPAEVNRLARGRAVIDYVASLTDAPGRRAARRAHRPLRAHRPPLDRRRGALTRPHARAAGTAAPGRRWPGCRRPPGPSRR